MLDGGFRGHVSVEGSRVFLRNNLSCGTRMSLARLWMKCHSAIISWIGIATLGARILSSDYFEE